MSSQIFPNTGKKAILNSYLGSNTLTYHLYQSSITVDRDTTLADMLAIECNFDGYSPQVASGWSMAIINSDFAAQSEASTLTWTVSGSTVGNNVWGYFSEDGSGNLIGVEQADGAPIDMNAIGNSFPLIPQITVKSEVSN